MKIIKGLSIVLMAAVATTLISCGDDEPASDLKITLTESSYNVYPDEMTADYVITGSELMPITLSKETALSAADFDVTDLSYKYHSEIDLDDDFHAVTQLPEIKIVSVYKDVNTGAYSLVAEYKADEDITWATFTFSLTYKGNIFATGVKMNYSRHYKLYSKDPIVAGGTSLIQVVGVEDGRIIDAGNYTIESCGYLGDRKVNFVNMTLSVPATFPFTAEEKAQGYAALRLEVKLYDRQLSRSMRVYGKFRLHTADE